MGSGTSGVRGEPGFGRRGWAVLDDLPPPPDPQDPEPDGAPAGEPEGYQLPDTVGVWKTVDGMICSVPGGR